MGVGQRARCPPAAGEDGNEETQEVTAMRQLRWMWPAALLALLVLVVAAAPAAAFEQRAGPSVAVGPGETIDDDLVATGTDITVAGHITGDLYAFGRSLTVADTA